MMREAMRERSVMAERSILIRKKYSSEGLTSADENRLEFLNAEANRLCPRVTEEMRKALQESINAVTPNVKVTG